MSLPKPRPIEFLMRGFDLADALSILDRWDSLSEAERAALGFTSDSEPLEDGPHPRGKRMDA